MANNYDKILELANANNMGLSNTIKRDFGIPLDYTSVQASYEAALTYAATNTLAYVGQPISVGDKLYIVTAESQGKYPAEVEEGGSQIDVFLAEVGSATEGDGSTIDLKDGVLSLHGIDGKTSGTYVPTLVDGVLTWNAPDTTTVDGLTASVDALNLKVFGKEAEGESEAVEGLVDIVESLEATIGVPANGDSAATGLIKAIDDNSTAINTKASIDYVDTQLDTKLDKELDDLNIRSSLDVGEDVPYDSSPDMSFFKGVSISPTAIDILQGFEDNYTSYKEKSIEVYVQGSKVNEFSFPIEGSGTFALTSDISTAISNLDLNSKLDLKANVADVYTKSDVYTKEEVNQALGSITTFSAQIVETLPAIGDPKVIYLVPRYGFDENSPDPISGEYLEYLFIDGNYEQIGTTSVDLTDYVTNNALATELAKYTTTEGLTTVLAPYAKTADVNIELAKKVDTETYTTDKATFALEESVASRLAGKAAVGDSYTKSEADDLLAAKADKETVNTELAKKIETAQLTHTTEGVGEGVTKDGTSLTITVDSYRKSEVYTKSETDNQIDAKIASVTGGESAADVKLALESYRDALNTEMWGADAANWTTRTTGEDGKVTVTYTPQYGATSRVDTLEADVATLKTNVQKAQNDATAAGTAVSTLESGKVATNTANIATIQGQITGEGGLSARIGTLEAYDTQHKTDYANLKGKVDTAVDTTIPALTNRVSNNETAIATINTTLNGAEGTDGLIATVSKKANAADVYTKGEIDTAVSDINTNIGKKADAATTYSKTEVDNAISTAIGNIDNTAITNNSADIAVLVGNDKGEDGRANKSIRAIAADEINTLIKAADPEGGKTIENINNLIAYVDENAGEIAELVTATTANTNKLEGIDTTVVAAIETAKNEAIAAIPALEVATADKLGGVKSATGDNKVTVSAEGVMSVNSIDVSTLTQSSGFVLILDGGNATN